MKNEEYVGNMLIQYFISKR